MALVWQFGGPKWAIGSGFARKRLYSQSLDTAGGQIVQGSPGAVNFCRIC
jgi:hypothetical protein